jgi:DNA-directed RNA polymerase specialized sigma24 family protein
VNDTQTEPPDEELIQRIRRKKEDEASAADAFTVFYRRHIQFLYRCVANADRLLVGFALGAEDIVEETFTKVWESGADSFTSPEGLDPDGASLWCKAWLSRIASNLVKDKLKSRRNVLPIDPGAENEALFVEPERVETVDRCVGIRQVVTMTLSERDAAIVWFKIRFYDPETGKSQPPPNAQDAFCKEWDITPTALRKAYDRALSAISEAYTVTTRSH